jgi:hypothetical protein
MRNHWLIILPINMVLQYFQPNSTCSLAFFQTLFRPHVYVPGARYHRFQVLVTCYTQFPSPNSSQKFVTNLDYKQER